MTPHRPNPETKAPAHTRVREEGGGRRVVYFTESQEREREKVERKHFSRQLLGGWDLASREDDIPHLLLRNPQTDLNTVRNFNGSDKGTGRVRSVAGMLSLLIRSSLP